MYVLLGVIVKIQSLSHAQRALDYCENRERESMIENTKKGKIADVRFYIESKHGPVQANTIKLQINCVVLSVLRVEN